MIEAEHVTTIDTDIAQVWDYVQDIQKWGLLFPGCKECEVIDTHNSRWIIKVGAGGLVKTVTVLVSVEQWNGPESVRFSYKLESEPVKGTGFYQAKQNSEKTTDIILQIKVEGSGQMAAMWEAMSRPLLPQMAKTFSSRLKEEIETLSGMTVAEKPSWLNRIKVIVKKMFASILKR